MRNKYFNLVLAGGMMALSLPVLAQQAAMTATATQIPLAEAKIVNFKQQADYDLAHPPIIAPRFIEQGEDVDADYKFVPKPVGPGAVSYNVPPANGAKALVNSPVASTTFTGVVDNGSLIPPDVRGAAGPTYVMETTNQEFKIYTKAGSLVSTVSIPTFFSASGGSGYFDPHIVYDPTNGRYIICIDGNASNGHGGLFLAVSQTNDPTGNWYVYGFDAAGNTTDFIDYPLLGYNNNWVVISANDFLGGTNPVTKVYVLNRASVYSGSMGTVSTFTDNGAFSLAPAQTYDNTQNTEYLVQDYNGNSGGNGYMQICTITGTATAPVFTAGATLGVNQPWSETSVGAKQSGSTKTLEDGDTRTGNALYINGSLWFCHSVFLPASSPTHTAVDWWQVNPSTNTVQQFGRVQDATGAIFYFYPSIAVNTNGDALLGYCQSSSTTFSGSAYSFHAGTDPANSMQSGYLYKSGLASYFKDYGSGRNRWGDYTMSAVDPSDNSFWNFSEYAGTSNNWGTVIAHVPVTPPACNAATGLTTSAISTTTATFSWTASAGATSYNIQYRVVGTTTWSTGTSTTTSFNASGLTASTNYEWQVQTVCASGSSAFTASATFTTAAVAICNAPTGLATSAITTSSATFGWTAAAGANSYNIQYRVVGTTTWSTGNSTTTSFNASGLTASTNYEWQAQTVCSSGSSAFTSSTTFTTAAPTCGVPASLASGSITASGASLTWGVVSGATSYSLEYKVTTAGTWTTVTGLTSASYNISGLVACTGYQFAVLSVCSFGSSAYSAAASFTTTGCPLNYCASKGGTSYEYINKVTLGTISNTSGNNNGYGNFTAQSTNLAGGAAASIGLTPGFVHGSY